MMGQEQTDHLSNLMADAMQESQPEEETSPDEGKPQFYTRPLAIRMERHVIPSHGWTFFSALGTPAPDGVLVALLFFFVNL